MVSNSEGVSILILCGIVLVLTGDSGQIALQSSRLSNGTPAGFCGCSAGSNNDVSLGIFLILLVLQVFYSEPSCGSRSGKSFSAAEFNSRSLAEFESPMDHLYFLLTCVIRAFVRMGPRH